MRSGDHHRHYIMNRHVRDLRVSTNASEAGKCETAAHHAHLARGDHEHAMHHAAEAAKAHIEVHGKAIPANA